MHNNPETCSTAPLARITIWHPALVMHAFKTTTFDSFSGPTAIDWNSPDELLMEAEENESEVIDFEAFKAVPKDALKTLLRFIVHQSSITPAKKWRISQIRLVLLCQMVDLDGCGSQSFESLAKELGCTRALLCHYSMKMIDSLGINKTPQGKRREVRQVYRERATAAHRRMGHKIKQDEPHGDS